MRAAARRHGSAVMLRARRSASMAMAALAALGVVAAHSADASEATLRMKGGDFSVTGEIKAYDGSRYSIESKMFGAMQLDATRFECVAGSCPKQPFIAPLAPVAGRAPARIVVSGSNSIGGALMPALIQAYAQSIGAKATRVVGADPLDVQWKLVDGSGRDLGTVDLRRRGTAAGLKELDHKTVQIAMASRAARPEEEQRLAGIGFPGLRSAGREHVVGLDGLVAIVAPQSPVVSISIETLAKIYAGTITDWGDLGLPSAPITVYAAAAGSGTADVLDELVMKPRNLAVAQAVRRSADLSELSDLVARDVNGIGIVGIGHQRNARMLNLEETCGLVLRPSVFAIKADEYPLTRRLYLYTAAELKEPLAAGVLAYALSGPAQPVIRQAEFVDQGIEALDFGLQTNRIANALNARPEHFDMALMRTLIAELKPAKRLSITFRFQSASFTLDTKSQADIGRLRDLLLQPDYADKTVMLVGFADAVGTFPTNLKLAERRAAAVHRALTGAGGRASTARIVTRAFGELAPVACNDGYEARQLNRRVEVWVRD